MLGLAFELVRPVLFALDPERAHELTLKSLEAGIYPRDLAADDARLATRVWQELERWCVNKDELRLQHKSNM
jgi:dihydroorotate dehydrogenase